jgi:TonB family protein
MRFNLLAGCFLSLGMHAGVFFLAPGFSLPPLPPSELPTEAELVVLDVPLPPALQPQMSSQPPALDKESLSAPASVSYDASKISPPDVQQIKGAIEKMSAGVSAQLPTPQLQLPTRNQLEGSPLPLSSPPEKLPAVTAEMLEQSLLSPGLSTGVDKQIGWGQVRLGDKKSPSRLGLPKLDRRLVARTLPTMPPLPLPPAPLPQFGIQGPAAKREPLYRPPLPKVQVQAESEITLKFWVRPDGVVSRILPERKGDTVLEAAATRYLEGWRFTPLPPHEPQVEQWGTITVRFLLHER